MDNKTLYRIVRNVVKIDNGCWLWLGSTNTTGYPQTKIKGRSALISRSLYEHYKQTIKPAMRLHNTCNDRQCVNPDHFEPATRSEIIHAHPPQTHKTCHAGHPRTPENIHVQPSGNIVCVVCYEAKHGYKPYVAVTHCPNGHEYTPENTHYTRKNTQTGKMCKTCNRERGKMRDWKKRKVGG